MSVSRVSFLRFSTLALAALSLPAFAAAQRGGVAGSGGAGHPGMMSHGVVVMHAAPVTHVAAAPAGRVARSGGVATAARTPHTGIRNGRHVNNNGVNFVPGLGETSFDDVPGLGFDFPHLAAVSGHNHFGRRFLGGVPFFDGGFLFGAPSVTIEQPGEAQPEADDVIAGNAVEKDPVRRSRRVYEADPGSARVSDPAPEEVEQYVFVKRDGGLEFAVAYSWIDGNLRYITPDGKRRTLGRDALDLPATQHFNEERGIEFHAPA